MAITAKRRKRVLAAYRAAILKVFRHAVTSETVDRALCLADEDPGEWAPKAYIVIRLDQGLPNPMESIGAIEPWITVDSVANGLLKKHKIRVFSEPINAAVMAVWRV